MERDGGGLGGNNAIIRLDQSEVKEKGDFRDAL